MQACPTPGLLAGTPRARGGAAGKPVDKLGLYALSLGTQHTDQQQATPTPKPTKSSPYIGVSRHSTKRAYESYFSNGGQHSTGAYADDKRAAHARDLGLLASCGPQRLSAYTCGTGRGLNFPLAMYVPLLPRLAALTQAVQNGRCSFAEGVKGLLADTAVQAKLVRALPLVIERLPGGRWAATIRFGNHEPIQVENFATEYEAIVAHDVAALAVNPDFTGTIFPSELYDFWLAGKRKFVVAGFGAALNATHPQEGALLLRTAAQGWAAALRDSLVPAALRAYARSISSSRQLAAEGSRATPDAPSHRDKGAYESPSCRTKGAHEKSLQWDAGASAAAPSAAAAAPASPALKAVIPAMKRSSSPSGGVSKGAAFRVHLTAAPRNAAPAGGASQRDAGRSRKPLPAAPQEDVSAAPASARVKPLSLAGPAATPDPKPSAKRAREAASPCGAPAAAGLFTPCPKRVRTSSRRYSSGEYVVPAAAEWTLSTVPEDSPGTEWTLGTVPEDGPETEWTLATVPEDSPEEEAAHTLLALRSSRVPLSGSALKHCEVARMWAFSAASACSCRSISPKEAEPLLALTGSQ